MSVDLGTGDRAPASAAFTEHRRAAGSARPRPTRSSAAARARTFVVTGCEHRHRRPGRRRPRADLRGHREPHRRRATPTRSCVGAGGSLTGTINGGAGADTLFGPDGARDLDGHGRELGHGGGDRPSPAFEKLVGGSANDVFLIRPGGSIASIDGGAVRLHLARASTRSTIASAAAAVTVNLATRSGPGVTAFASIEAIVGTAPRRHPRPAPRRRRPDAVDDRRRQRGHGRRRDFARLRAPRRARTPPATPSCSPPPAGSTASRAGPAAGVVDGFAVGDALVLRAYQPGGTTCRARSRSLGVPITYSRDGRVHAGRRDRRRPASSPARSSTARSRSATRHRRASSS